MKGLNPNSRWRWGVGGGIMVVKLRTQKSKEGDIISSQEIVNRVVVLVVSFTQ